MPHARQDKPSWVAWFKKGARPWQQQHGGDPFAAGSEDDVARADTNHQHGGSSHGATTHGSSSHGSGSSSHTPGSEPGKQGAQEPSLWDGIVAAWEQQQAQFAAAVAPHQQALAAHLSSIDFVSPAAVGAAAPWAAAALLPIALWCTLW